MSSDSRDLLLEDLRKMEEQLRGASPILQAIAIYDCEATKDQCHLLDYDVDLLSIAVTFGAEAGPIVRWFWKSKPVTDLFRLDLDLEVVPINKYGQALVLSQKAFDSLPPQDNQFLGPRVYNLNGDKRL